MCHAEQYRIHTKKVTVKKQQKKNMKCKRVTSLDKYLTCVISMMSRKGFSM